MLANKAPATESAERLSTRVFTELHRSILNHEAGAVAGDVEAVHDMRVAIRRLRVALSNFAFCIGREDRQRLRTRLEHLAGALGGVRDLDVMIAALESNLPVRIAVDRPAISAWIRRLKSRRRGRQRQLSEYLCGEEYAAFKREFPPEAEPQEGRSHGEAA